jgi:DNA-directed RNA polymerase specialized sigma24 family protein
MLDESKFSEDRPEFSECIYIIDSELQKRKSRWRLNSIAWMDFDDVCQKIRLHIFNKWEQWDNKRALRPWINTIITNQMTNLVRNNYSSFSKPCLQCKYNQGGNLCEVYGVQNSECSEYSKWESGKKDAYSVKMPVSLDASTLDQNGEKKQQALDVPDNYSYIDYESKTLSFHRAMKLKLSAIDWRVYNLLYIENLDEIEAAKLMGYKTSEKNRSPGYKQIKKIKNKIYKIAKLILLES